MKTLNIQLIEKEKLAVIFENMAMDKTLSCHIFKIRNNPNFDDSKKELLETYRTRYALWQHAKKVLGDNHKVFD